MPPRAMTSGKGFLPYGRHHLDDDDIEAVTAVLKSDFLTTGPVTPAFEEALAGKVGARHAVACSSGTAGLHLALLALGTRRPVRLVQPRERSFVSHGPRHPFTMTVNPPGQGLFPGPHLVKRADQQARKEGQSYTAQVIQQPG